MALRARRRQGGGSNYTKGIGSVLAQGVPGAVQAQVKGPPKGLPSGGVDKPVVQAPSAAYVRRPPPAPSAPIRGANSEQLRSNADISLNRAKTDNRDSIYRAIMQLGDPTQFAKYQADPNFSGYNFTQDPNSIWASLARQQDKGLHDIDVGANAGNTFFSGMRLGDRKNLTDEADRQRLAGSTQFGEDVRGFNSALGGSEDAYRSAYADADQMDIDAALERDRQAREAWEFEQANMPEGDGSAPPKGIGGQVPLGPSTGLVTPQQRSAAYAFAQQQAARRAREEAERRRRRGR